jgi:1-aminocyclopropane-1-carboxylate synthase
MRTGVQVVPVSSKEVDPCHLYRVQKYEEARLGLNKQGLPICALLLCHPHNPLGRCYPRDTITGLMRLYQKYQIHLVSNKIYALFTWKNTVNSISHRNVGFKSVSPIHIEDIINPSLVHAFWGV